MKEGPHSYVSYLQISAFPVSITLLSDATAGPELYCVAALSGVITLPWSRDNVWKQSAHDPSAVTLLHHFRHCQIFHSIQIIVPHPKWQNRLVAGGGGDKATILLCK